MELFKKYDIRASWGIVGHMLQSKDPWRNGIAHPEIPRPIVFGESSDWFYQLPHDISSSMWYGQDLVESVKNSLPKQEIGSHSFCHMPYCEKTTNPDSIEADIKLAKEQHAEKGLPFEFFIFPRNKIGFRGLLAKHGIKFYRGNILRWYDRLPIGFVRRVLNLLSYILAVPPRTVLPKKDKFGLVSIPGSMLLTERNGLRHLIPRDNLTRMAVAGLGRAIRKKEVFHLWFHPSNFAYNTEDQLATLEKILQQVSIFREEGILEQKTVGEIAESA